MDRNFGAFAAVLVVCVVSTLPANGQPPPPPPSNRVPNEVVYSWATAMTNIDFPDWHVGKVVRNVQGLTATWFEVLAAYSPSYRGWLFGRQLARPPAEWTTYNKNVALSYASYRLLCDFLPGFVETFNATMLRFGLDPGDLYPDTSNPVGLGNTIGFAAVAHYANDGFNSHGNLGPTGEPYSDYTGYNPVGSENFNPDRWQPLLQTFRFDTQMDGVFWTQVMESPYMGMIKTTAINPNDYIMGPPISWYLNRSVYEAQVNDVLARSANLNDVTKMKAEHFNNKYSSLGQMGNFLARKHNFTQDQYIVYDFFLNSVILDAIAASWNSKMMWDRLRPETAVRFVYERQNVTAWGGPFKGTQTFPGNRWHSYLLTMPHSEYPSGSTCLCTAFATAARMYFNSDELGWSVVKIKGSSWIEPGAVPAQNLTLSWATLSEYITDCGNGRINGGVHFQQSVTDAWATCGKIAEAVYQVWLYYNGTASSLPSTSSTAFPSASQYATSTTSSTSSSGAASGSTSGGASGSAIVSSTSSAAPSTTSCPSSANDSAEAALAEASTFRAVMWVFIVFAIVGWCLFAATIVAWIILHRQHGSIVWSPFQQTGAARYSQHLDMGGDD